MVSIYYAITFYSDNHVQSIRDIIKMIQTKYIDITNEMSLEVRRDEVLEDALMHAALKKFSPLRALKVYHCELAM